VQKDKRSGYVALSLVCLSAAMLAGCRSTPSPLAEATARAERLYDRACSLLNDAPYMVNKQYAPFAKLIELPSDPNAAVKLIQITDLGQVNPQADLALNDAIKGLTEAMAAGEGRPEIEKLNAQVVLARLYALRGYSMSLGAGMKRRQAWDVADQVESAAVSIGGLGKQVATQDQLLSVTDESLGKMAETAKSQQSAAEAKMADANTAIAKLDSEEAELKAANVKIFEDSRKLLADSQLADPVRGVVIYDEAKTKEDKAGVNSARLAQIDETRQILKSKLAEFEVARAGAVNQVKLAGSMAEARQKSRSETEQERKDQIGKLTDAQKQAEMLAGKVVELVKAAAADEAKAAADYDKAVKAYQAYEQTTESYARDAAADNFLKPDPAILAMLGDVQMAWADLRVQAYLLQQRLDVVVAETSGIWSGLPTQNTTPAVIGQMKNYVSDAGKMKEDAQRDFSWAARAYEKAVAAVKDPKLKWPYVLQQSAADVSLYRLSGDADAKQKATTALDSLHGEEASPRIAPTADDFRKMLAAPPLLGPAAAAGSATTKPAP